MNNPLHNIKIEMMYIYGFQAKCHTVRLNVWLLIPKLSNLSHFRSLLYCSRRTTTLSPLQELDNDRSAYVLRCIQWPSDKDDKAVRGGRGRGGLNNRSFRFQPSHNQYWIKFILKVDTSLGTLFLQCGTLRGRSGNRRWNLVVWFSGYGAANQL